MDHGSSNGSSMDIDQNVKNDKQMLQNQTTSNSANRPPAPSKSIDLAAIKAKLAAGQKKVEELKAKQAEKKTSTSLQTHSSPASESILSGNLVAPATSAANARFHHEEMERRMKEEKKKFVKEQKEISAQHLNDPHYDHRMKKMSVERKPKAMVFLEPGVLTKRAEQEQQRIQKMVEDKSKISTESKFTSKETKSSDISSNLAKQRQLYLSQLKPPSIEWWDENFVHQNLVSIKMEPDGDMNHSDASNVSNNFFEYQIKDHLINENIIHPQMSDPPAEPPPPPPRPLMLTKQEQQKITKQRRREAFELRREEEILGIRPTEKGRVRISNMMKVYKEAVLDPTEVEAKVKAEMAAREARHQARNEERKLTKEQRKAKEHEKLIEDTSASLHVAVFKVISLENPKNRYKVDAEANKNLMTGVAIFSSEFALVVVEGGPKAIRRYTKKMLKKIPWTDPLPSNANQQSSEDSHPMKVESSSAQAPGDSRSDSPDVGEEGNKKKQSWILGKKLADQSENKCWLVWSGEVIKRYFGKFHCHHTPKGPRFYLEGLGLAHYWDAASNFVPPETVVDL